MNKRTTYSFRGVLSLMLLFSIFGNFFIFSNNSYADNNKGNSKYYTAKDIYQRYLDATGGDQNTQNYKFDYSKPAPTYGQLSQTKFTQASLGKFGGIALDSQGKVWTWGYGMAGKNASGSYIGFQEYYGGMKQIDFFIDKGINIVKIEAGYETNYALDDKGNLYAWGRGLEGQVANGMVLHANPNPVKVGISAKVVEFSPARTTGSNLLDAGAHHIVALDENGTMWMWGRGTNGRIPGSERTTTRPVKVSTPANVKFTKLSPGEASTLALAEDGTVWSMGSRTKGALGDGSTSGKTKTFNRIAGLDNIVEIDTFSYVNLARDKDGNVYQWGQIQGRGTVTKPEKITVSAAEKGYVGYEPVATKIAAGEYTSFFIDQFGRSWSWGSNSNYGFSREGGDIDAKGMSTREAVLYPRIIGDGDTQAKDSSAKFPKYVTDNDKDLNASIKFGYGVSDWHPTAYDQKYMLKDASGNVLDVDGNVLSYIGGYYYIKGTKTKSTPAIDPSEKWIELAFKQPPYFTDISATATTTVFVDKSGNLFISSKEASGSLGWGWDYEFKYDITGDPRNGVYDKYMRELTYLRGGSPAMPQVDISYTKTDEKIYTVDNKKSELIMNASLPAGENVEFKNLEYVIVPYDMANEDAYKNITENDFNELLKNTAYENGSLSKDDVKVDGNNIEARVSVDDNSVVIARTNIEVNGTKIDSEINISVFDNFYTEIAVEHNGLGDSTNLEGHNGEKDVIVYDYTKENVSKGNDDGQKYIGLPLDAKGNVISSAPNGNGGVKDSEPSHGYDSVKITSYNKDKFKDEGWDLVLPTGHKGDSITIEQKLDNIFVSGKPEIVKDKEYKYTFGYIGNENLLSEAEVNVVYIDETIKDRYFAHLEIENVNAKKGRVFVFKKGVVKDGVTKPDAVLDKKNILGVFNTDKDGLLSTKTNDEFAETLINEYGGDLSKNTIERIPIKGTEANPEFEYPIYIVFQEGDFEVEPAKDQKLLSKIVKDEVKEAVLDEYTALELIDADIMGIKIIAEKGAKVNILNAKTGELISDKNVEATGVLQNIYYLEDLVKGDRIQITAEKEGKRVSIAFRNIR